MKENRLFDRISFTKELREMEAEVFIKNILCEKLHAAHIVVGTDFAFGHEKRGNTEMLKMFSEKGIYAGCHRKRTI